MKAAPFVLSVAALMPVAIASAEEPPTAVAQAEATEAAPAPEETAPVTTETTPPPSVDVPAEPAQEEAPAAAPSITVNGFVSTAYVLNVNDPATESNQLRVFDFNEGTFSLDVAELVVQKPVGDPGSVGFRVDLALGSAIPPIEASAGLFRDAMGVAGSIDVQQAYIAYVLPGSSGIRLDIGKFITHMGYEVIEGYDGWNDNYSRSILFGYAIPFTHTGVHAIIPVPSANLTAMLMLVNGSDVAIDNNDAPAWGLQLAWTPSPKVTAYLNYVGGPEATGNTDDMRHIVDLVLVSSPVDKLSLAVNADFGVDAASDVNMDGDDDSWFGVAGYAKYAVSDAFALTLRGEYFADQGGARTGAEQNVFELTLTPAYTVAPGFVVRGDVRFDKSDEKVFVTDDAADPSDSQVTVAVNALASF